MEYLQSKTSAQEVDVGIEEMLGLVCDLCPRDGFPSSLLEFVKLKSALKDLQDQTENVPSCLPGHRQTCRRPS